MAAWSLKEKGWLYRVTVSFLLHLVFSRVLLGLFFLSCPPAC